MNGGHVDIWITPQEAGRLLGVKHHTLKRYAELGHLQVQKTVGGHRRYNLAQVEQLAAAGSLPNKPWAGFRASKAAV